jgi:hypothetical protein
MLSNSGIGVNKSDLRDDTIDLPYSMKVTLGIIDTLNASRAKKDFFDP